MSAIQFNNYSEKLPEVFERAHRALEAHKGELSETQYNLSLRLIYGLGIVKNHADELAELRDETTRNVRVNELTGNLGAEPGLFPGREPKQIRESIDIRVNNFVTAFTQFEKDETLLEFFIYGSEWGDGPCFNGRVESLDRFIDMRYNKKSELYFETKTNIDNPATELEEQMYEYAEKARLEENVVPTLDQMRDYLGAEWFQNRGSADAIYSRACEFYI